jgi:hypothetical protein
MIKILRNQVKDQVIVKIGRIGRTEKKIFDQVVLKVSEVWRQVYRSVKDYEKY